MEDPSLFCVHTLGFSGFQNALFILGLFSIVGDWLKPWVKT